LDCFEVGKAVREADSEVSEAIDFCRYYASEMERLDQGITTTSLVKQIAITISHAELLW